MKHPVLENLGSLRYCADDTLEYAVEDLITEHESGFAEMIEERVMRAEALAILAHEFRRREKTDEH